MVARTAGTGIFSSAICFKKCWSQVFSKAQIHTKHATGAYNDNCTFSSTDSRAHTRYRHGHRYNFVAQTRNRQRQRHFQKNADTLHTQTTLIHEITDMSQTKTGCRQPCLFNSARDIWKHQKQKYESTESVNRIFLPSSGQSWRCEHKC